MKDILIIGNGISGMMCAIRCAERGMHVRLIAPGPSEQSQSVMAAGGINAVTAEQVKAMIAKYFDKSKMTISIVGPVSMFESLKPFTVIPLDSLEFR